ncbi:unnamed protein product, partial [marine sediment metagenome]
LARTFNHIYVPRFIKAKYNGKKLITGFGYKYGDLPAVIKRRIIKNMDNVECLTKPPIPFHDPSMGPGEIEIARGCTHTCPFSISGDSRIVTEQGLLKVSDMRSGIVQKLNEDVKYSDISIRVASDDGTKEATCWLDEGVRDLYRVSTKRGHYIDCTPNHKLRVIDVNGNYIWREAQEQYNLLIYQ